GSPRWSLMHLFFFFQAEDGIRDFHVTGVQTCALPISDATRASMGSPEQGAQQECNSSLSPFSGNTSLSRFTGVLTVLRRRSASRSEERRVGKECRPRRSRGQ